MGWGSWQWPSGVLAWAAVLVAASFCAAHWLRGRLERVGLWLLALLAAVASAAYVPLVLRGGPRIIDSTMYWLQASSLARGQLTLGIDGPATSVRGRFLLETEPGRFAGIFPPGYPAVLAPFQAAGVPWLLGPLLALALTVQTAHLAGLLAPLAERRRAQQVAAGLSLVCGALRYHTADTMSHGLTMLAVVTALVCVLQEFRGALVCAGLCLGLVACTRFASALALAPILCGLLLRDDRRSLGRLSVLALGAVPCLLLLLAYQRAVTGSAFVTPQSLYYARADAPAGCFRYGFGAGIGCDFEHGDFVRAHLPNHVYGAWESLQTSARRLRLHALDVANFEPLLLLVVLGALRLRGATRHALRIYPVLVVLVYAPFYFDGNYPGGGARFLSDALPLEHALIAVAVSGSARWARATVATSALAFAVHAAPEHAKLAARDGGIPMWTDAALTSGASLVFTNTDHGFDLGYARSPARVARLRGDANDSLLAERFPGARVAFFDVERGFSFFDFVPASPPWRFELEHEWPVRAAHDVTAIPQAAPDCSAGRVLQIAPTRPDATLTTSTWLPAAGDYRVSVWAKATTPSMLQLTLAGRTVSLTIGTECTRIDVGAFALDKGDQNVMWHPKGALALDALEIEPVLALRP